eukprot:810081-Ditylum_brightwellii.AAC.1
MYKAFSVPQIYMEKWSYIKTIYTMHTQLLRYYDYLNDDVEDDGDRKRKHKKKKNIHQPRQDGQFLTLMTSLQLEVITMTYIEEASVITERFLPF